MTRPAEAARVLARLEPYMRFVAPASNDELRQRAADFAATIKHAPDGWAEGWLAEELDAGRVPTLIDFPRAWRLSVSEQAAAAIATIPRAPREVEADGARWVAWERARRAALLGGASAEAAVSAADRSVGVTARTPEPVASAAEAREHVRKVLADVARRRALTTEDGDS